MFSLEYSLIIYPYSHINPRSTLKMKFFYNEKWLWWKLIGCEHWFVSGNAEWRRCKIALQRPKCNNIMHNWGENILLEYVLLSVYSIFIAGYFKNSTTCTTVKDKTCLSCRQNLSTVYSWTRDKTRKEGRKEGRKKERKKKERKKEERKKKERWKKK